MKSICLMVVYMGRLPEYFNIWMSSCKYNQSIDFFVFTDDLSNYECPENVKIIHVTFKEVQNRIQSIFNFPIILDKPYKLCDYKPVYGEAFSDYIKKYDYWGYCDLDIIWGDIRKFITNDILEKYERIFTRGHCSIFKNSLKTNSLYRTLPSLGCNDYKKVFTSKKNYCFDEWAGHCGWGLSEILRRNNIKQYNEIVFADIYFLSHQFRINNLSHTKKSKYCIFQFKEGVLNAIYKANDKVYNQEFMYCHFQKRNLDIKCKDLNKFILAPPNLIVEYEDIKNLYELKRICRKKIIYPFIFKFRSKQILKKIKKLVVKNEK